VQKFQEYAASGSLCRGTGAAAEAALFDLRRRIHATPRELFGSNVDCVALRRQQAGKRIGLPRRSSPKRINPGDEVKIICSEKALEWIFCDAARIRRQPIIMGRSRHGFIAPFRAFLLIVRATGAPARNWMFFGHQRSECDLLHADELNSIKDVGDWLTRPVAAGSRDGARNSTFRDRHARKGRPEGQRSDHGSRGGHVYIWATDQAHGQGVERAAGRYSSPVRAPGSDRRAPSSSSRELKKKGRSQQDVYYLLNQGPSRPNPNEYNILAGPRRGRNVSLQSEIIRESVRIVFWRDALPAGAKRYSHMQPC